VGGHCISVDPWFLVEAAPELTPLIHTARQVNDSQPQFVVELARRALSGSLAGKQVAALGLAYKPDVDDLRESPAIEVCNLLQAAGAAVAAFEPFKPGAQFDQFKTTPTLAQAIEDADLLLLLVGHATLRSLDPVVVAQLTRARVVVDATGGWTESSWRGLGFGFYRLGVNKR